MNTTSNNNNRLKPCTESSFINVYYCNARSICNKLPMLISLLYSNIYDILIFTETWLNNNMFNSLLNLNDKHMLYRLDRNINTHGGGILVYVNMHYNTFIKILN